MFTPVTLPPGLLRLATRPSCDRVAADGEDNRNGCGRRLGGKCRGSAPGCDDHVHLPANQIGRQRRQSIILTLGPAVLDRHVAALDIAGFAQALAECGDVARERVRRPAVKKPDHRHRRLLRPRRERPRHRRAAEQRYELPPPHAEHGAPSHGCRRRSYQLGTAGRRRFDASGACRGRVSRSLGRT